MTEGRGGERGGVGWCVWEGGRIRSPRRWSLLFFGSGDIGDGLRRILLFGPRVCCELDWVLVCLDF